MSHPGRVEGLVNKWIDKEHTEIDSLIDNKYIEIDR